MRYHVAVLIADLLLTGKVDKHGQPLINHCQRVAAACRAQNLTEDQCIAAVLHDTAEEHNAPTQVIGAIELLFGFDVANMVDYLTRRPNCLYVQYILRLEDLPATIPIKIADLADNLDPSRGPIPESLRARYQHAKALLEASSALTAPPK
jgi:(p)ppGpp synthase/HD superfamily hydrolase